MPGTKSKSKELNLLEGDILSSIFRLSAPIMLGALLQTVYTMTDMFWVGRLGDLEVASVGTCGMILWFTQGLLNAPKVGGQVFTGQSLGAQQLKSARKYCRNSLQLTALFSLAISLVLLIGRYQVRAIFDFSNPVTQASFMDYYLVVIGGLIFTALPPMCASLLTASGDTRTPFIVTLIGLGTNMLLDPLMILHFSWGVRGAAIATICSQALQVFIYYLYIHRRELFTKMRPLSLLDSNACREILKLGAPSSLMNIFYAGTSIALARIVSGFGDMAIAGQRIGTNVESISYSGAEGFALALSALLAQNYGAKQYRRSREIYRKGLFLIFLFSCFTSFLLFFFGRNFAQLFLSQPESIEHCSNYLRILSYSQLFMNLEIILVAAFAALGNTFTPAVIVTFIMFLRVPIAYFLSRTNLGATGIWWSISGTSMMKGAILYLIFDQFQRRRLREPF
ncbi:MAG: MATE family efflux transporter [Eubacteriales bacterium]|nr:MATE family efflux transporter [Eubacteriales bacterium]